MSNVGVARPHPCERALRRVSCKKGLWLQVPESLTTMMTAFGHYTHRTGARPTRPAAGLTRRSNSPLFTPTNQRDHGGPQGTLSRGDHAGPCGTWGTNGIHGT